MDVTLHTRRLVLRAMAVSDVPALVVGLNDYEVTRYLTMVPYPYSDAEARGWVESRPALMPGRAHFAIDLPGTGMIGSVALENELGFWLAQPHHGAGLMTEACVALLDWHFEALPENIVPSGAHLGNEASLNVQRKLGFVETGRSMRFARSHGVDVLHVETMLTADAYKIARRELVS